MDLTPQRASGKQVSEKARLESANTDLVAGALESDGGHGCCSSGERERGKMTARVRCAGFYIAGREEQRAQRRPGSQDVHMMKAQNHWGIVYR